MLLNFPQRKKRLTQSEFDSRIKMLMEMFRLMEHKESNSANVSKISGGEKKSLREDHKT
jgi:ABC-type multidrug transport system ATPase subunit